MAAANKQLAIGIDLGTCYSCVGVYRDGAVQIIANSQGNRTTPSYVAFTDTERLVGDAAKNQAPMNPTNTVFDAKRLIGRKFNDSVVQADMRHFPFKVVSDDGGRAAIQVEFKEEKKMVKPEEVSAMVLRYMKETAEAFLGQPVTAAVITTPAYFSDAQRASTRDAGTIAGLNVLRIINEPTAAALAYGLDKDTQTEKNVLIFDCGGGTHDVSLLTIDGGVFEVKATGGNTHLGGSDFDGRLVAHFVDEFKRKHKKDLTGNKRALQRLRTACERAKRSLSTTTQAMVEVESLMDGQDFSSTISRAKFEDLCADLFRDTVAPVDQVLRDAKLDKSQVHEVVLVGGSTRIPKIQELLSKYFGGKELNRSVSVDEAVAYGAAVQAAILTGTRDANLDQVVLCDIASLSMGIETSGQIMTRVVERGTSIPTRKTKIFSTYSDNQTQMDIKIYEGERAMTHQCNLLGKFDLTGIAPAPRGVPQVEIAFDVDTNGILNVTAVDKGTGKSNKITITNDAGRMSKEEIERMINEAEKHKAEDEELRRTLDVKQHMEQFLYSAKRTTEEKKGTFTEEDKATVESTVKMGLEWIQQHPQEKREVYEAKQKELETVLHPIMAKVYAQTGEQPTTTSDTPPGSDEPKASGFKVEELD